MSIRCSCIIPCYNEAPRVRSVLDVVTKMPIIEEIICVDDGSVDGTPEVISAHYPQITLIRLGENQGKTAAVLKGVLEARGEYVFLLDADLLDLKEMELAQAIVKILQDPEIDMIVLKHLKLMPTTKMIRGGVVISGQRILRRKDLLDVIDDGSVVGYQLEPAINQYMLDNEKTVRWLPESSFAVRAHQKFGLLGGLEKEVRMMSSIISYCGWAEFLRQVLIFCRLRA